MKKKETNFKRLDELTEEGYLRKVTSPCGKLFLYNYTDKCTYEKKWNKHTLNARGTVYEVGTGNIIARAFPKFFNFGELQPVIQKTLMRKSEFEAFEKMDGSLGIIYYYNGTWRCNTRGSFTSSQALHAMVLLNNKYKMQDRCIGYTILAEIIYPQNRIIVDYGNEEKLTVLSVVSKSGKEFTHDTAKEIVEDMGFSVAPRYKFKNIAEVVDTQAKLGKMEEGFVVRFQDGYRAKFKSVEYLKVARLISEMTLLNFWKAMVNGQVQPEIIEEIPEEFREECDRLQGDIEKSYNKVKKEVTLDFIYAVKCLGGLYDLDEDRKKLGILIKENGSELKHAGAMFPMLLNKGVDKYIMRSIRPSGNQVVV